MSLRKIIGIICFIILLLILGIQVSKSFGCDPSYFQKSFETIKKQFFSKAEFFKDDAIWCVSDETDDKFPKVHYFLVLESSRFVGKQIYQVYASKQIRYPGDVTEIYHEGVRLYPGKGYIYFSEHYIVRQETGYESEELPCEPCRDIWHEVIYHFFGGYCI